MQTSCPECRTTFRVSQEQLGLRRGLVRCGTCNAVFNAYDTLLPELEGAPFIQEPTSTPDAPESQPYPTHGQDALQPFPDQTVDAETSAPSAGYLGAEPMGADEVLAEVDTTLSILSRQALSDYDEVANLSLDLGQDETTGEGELETLSSMPQDQSGPEPETQVASTPEPPSEQEETPDDILLSDFRKPAKKLPAWQKGLYLLASLLLLLVLLGQIAYFLRGELAAAVPASRPALTFLCQPLGCVVPLPTQLTRQAIVSSSLEHDPEQRSRVQLTLLLANRTNQVQTWPNILLSLSDVRETPVAQKAFPPEVYLPRGIRAQAGFPPQSEQEIRLELDIGNLQAASYVVNVAYP